MSSPLHGDLTTSPGPLQEQNPITMPESTPQIDFDFGIAIRLLKEGKKVCRAGWNGKGVYLWLLPTAIVKREWVKDPMLLSVFGEREELSCLGSIRMLTATGEVLTGWLASQTDMLAEDWQVVN